MIHLHDFAPSFHSLPATPPPTTTVPQSEFGFEASDLAELRTFLRSSRQRLHQKLHLVPEVHVVLGNQAADLDSIVSSIALAFHLSKSVGLQALCLPVINICREKLTLRKETLYLFEQFGINAEDLVFLDDEVSLETISRHGKLQLHLVDHNELAPAQAHLSSAVSSIIDHHKDSKQFPDVKQKIVQKVGSCTSLIAKLMDLDQMSKALAGLLLAPILVDTGNGASEDKYTQLDREVAEKLLKHTTGLLPANYYERIKAKKKDISGIPKPLLLEKDPKIYKVKDLQYGISRLPTSEGFWTEDQASLVPLLEAYSLKEKLGLLILLMPLQKQRGIVFYSNRPLGALLAHPSFATLAEYVQSHENMAFFKCPATCTRKELQPIIHEILEKSDL